MKIITIILALFVLICRVFNKNVTNDEEGLITMKTEEINIARSNVVKDKARELGTYQEVIKFVQRYIAYDYIRMSQSKNITIADVRSPEETLAKHMGICFDQCVLAAEMLDYLGVPYRIVAGILNPDNGTPFATFHSWLLVEVDGVWRKCDVTWGTRHKASDYGEPTTEYVVHFV